MAMRYKGRQSFKGYKCMPNGTVSGSGISPRPIVRNEIAWDVSSCCKDAVYGLLIERGTMNGPGMINRSWKSVQEPEITPLRTACSPSNQIPLLWQCTTRKWYRFCQSFNDDDAHLRPKKSSTSLHLPTLFDSTLLESSILLLRTEISDGIEWKAKKKRKSGRKNRALESEGESNQRVINTWFNTAHLPLVSSHRQPTPFDSCLYSIPPHCTRPSRCVHSSEHPYSFLRTLCSRSHPFVPSPRSFVSLAPLDLSLFLAPPSLLIFFHFALPVVSAFFRVRPFLLFSS